MNIVMIGPFAFRPKGTVSARALPIARALVQRGHRVTIVMPPYDHPVDSGRVWEQAGVRLENVRLGRSEAGRALTLPARLAWRAAELAPDVVHVFKPIGYGGLAGAVLIRLTRRPVVLDTDDWEGSGGWSDVNRWPRLRRCVFDWQERWLARHAHAVTVASRTLQTQVWGFGVDPARVVYLPNGPVAELREAAAAPAGRQAELRAALGVGDAPLALYLGHIPHGSDLDLALEAWPQVASRLPEARLVIAGEGAGLPALRSRAEALGLAGPVLFPGWIDHDQAPAYWAAADVVVNPYRDTLINRAKCAGKVVAAMAMGKAVVTARVGQNLEYIEDGVSGVLVEPGEVGELAHALVGLLADRARAASVGQQAQRRIWARFDWDTRAGEVERAYSIAQGRKGRRG